MIQICKWTCITQLDDDASSIPLYSLTFSTFSEAEKRRHNDSVLTGNIFFGIINYKIIIRTFRQSAGSLLVIQTTGLDKDKECF